MILTDLIYTSLRTGEADEVRTETEASTLAGRHTDGGGDEVKDGEHGRSDEGEGGDFIEGKGLPGDEDGSASNDEAFDEVLDCAIHNFSNVHLDSIFPTKKFFGVLRKERLKTNGFSL
jgi:hypothetical protein